MAHRLADGDSIVLDGTWSHVENCAVAVRLLQLEEHAFRMDSKFPLPLGLDNCSV